MLRKKVKINCEAVALLFWGSFKDDTEKNWKFLPPPVIVLSSHNYDQFHLTFQKHGRIFFENQSFTTWMEIYTMVIFFYEVIESQKSLS